MLRKSPFLNFGCRRTCMPDYLAAFLPRSCRPAAMFFLFSWPLFCQTELSQAHVATFAHLSKVTHLSSFSGQEDPLLPQPSSTRWSFRVIHIGHSHRSLSHSPQMSPDLPRSQMSIFSGRNAAILGIPLDLRSGQASLPLPAGS